MCVYMCVCMRVLVVMVKTELEINHALLQPVLGTRYVSGGESAHRVRAHTVEKWTMDGRTPGSTYFLPLSVQCWN